MIIRILIIKDGLTNIPGTVLSRKKARSVPARFGFPSIICIIWSAVALPVITQQMHRFSYNPVDTKQKNI